MMKTKILLIAFVITGTILFDGCLKKGEDDPFLSLRSRKARVVGDWEVVSYKYTDTYNSYSNPSQNNIYTYTMNGSTYTSVSTYPNNPSNNYTSSGTETIDWTFEKDGTYKQTNTQDGQMYTSEGTWNFTSGVGELKNKSQITIYGQKYTGTGYSSTYTGNYVDMAYDLKELKNKKMVWYYKYTYSGTNSNSSYEEEIEFEEK